MQQTKWTVLLGVLVACFAPVVSSAQTTGSTVTGHVAVQEARGNKTVAKIPLPPGEWEVSDSVLRKSLANDAADMRDIRLIQVVKDDQGLALHHTIEITMKVGGPNITWNDEPCKISPVIAKNDFGTRLFKQKCLTLISDGYLQNNSAYTQKSLADLARRGVRHDYNALTLTYTRFGDFGHFLIVRHFFFPSRYGLDNPRIGMPNESPWHPSRVGLDPARQRLVDAIFKYGEQIAPALDKAYLREEPGVIGAFEFR